MSAAVTDLVAQNCAGQADARRVLHDIRHTIPSPDLLHERLQSVLLTAEKERLRAFCRRLQKALERGGDE